MAWCLVIHPPPICSPRPCPPPPTCLPTTQRAGNCLLSYNNRPATEVIPLLSPVIVPSARVLGPIINQIAASPIRTTVEVRHASRDSSNIGLHDGTCRVVHRITEVSDRALTKFQPAISGAAVCA